MSEPKIDDVRIARALVRYQGNISAAARALAIELKMAVSRGYVSKRIDSSAALQGLLEEIRDSLIDEAEAAIFKQVMDGKLEESKFVLTTLGRSRGYTKTTVVAHEEAALLAHRLHEARQKVRRPANGPSVPRRRRNDADVGVPGSLKLLQSGD